MTRCVYITNHIKSQNGFEILFIIDFNANKKFQICPSLLGI